MTDQTAPRAVTKTVTRTVELAVTGHPDVENKYGPGHIRPRVIELRFRGRSVHAQVYGLWIREDGEHTDDPCSQDYTARYGDLSQWPGWLADLAGEHTPAAQRERARVEVLRDAADKLDRIGHGAAAFILRDDASRPPAASA